MSRRHWPPIGVALAIALIVAATRVYPGGTMDASGSVGYSWARNFISALFAPLALNGADNTARYVAIPAVFLLCTSIGVMFWQVSRRAPSRSRPPASDRRSIRVSSSRRCTISW